MTQNQTLRFLFALAVASIGVGATCVNTRNVNTALDVTQAACVLIHEQVDDAATLAKICNVTDALLPEVRKLIFARKSAKKMLAASASASASSAPACPSTSGSAK